MVKRMVAEFSDREVQYPIHDNAFGNGLSAREDNDSCTLLAIRRKTSTTERDICLALTAILNLCFAMFRSSALSFVVRLSQGSCQ